MIKAAAFILLLGGTVDSLLDRSCTIVVMPPTRFDFEEFVFIATVRGYTENQNFSDVDSLASALVLGVIDTIHFPSNSHSVILYPFGYNSMCGQTGIHKTGLSKRYPVGSILYVVARHFMIFGDSTDTDGILLTTRTYGGTLLTRIADQLAYTDSKTELNYKSYIKKASRLKKKIEDADLYLRNEKYQTYEWLPYFEIRKDLLRLQRAEAETERVKIITRLARSKLYSPKPLKELITNHITDETERSKLIKKYVQE